jgi:hypothetical protein
LSFSILFDRLKHTIEGCQHRSSYQLGQQLELERLEQHLVRQMVPPLVVEKQLLVVELERPLEQEPA